MAAISTGVKGIESVVESSTIHFVLTPDVIGDAKRVCALGSSTNPEALDSADAITRALAQHLGPGYYKAIKSDDGGWVYTKLPPQSIYLSD